MIQYNLTFIAIFLVLPYLGNTFNLVHKRGLYSVFKQKGSCSPNFHQYHPKSHSLVELNHARNKLKMVSAIDVPSLSQPRTNKDNVVIPLPQHDKLVQGKLENGLTYIILPNAVPEGRFEAHLEVLSGSAFELEPQQGMAHLLEHVAYMGSPKR